MTNVNTMTGHYFWVAVYNDGTQLLQYDPAPTGFILHSFYEIDQKKLKQFVIVDALDNNKRYGIDFDPETMELIWYWKNSMILGMNASQKEAIRIVDTCFGWKKNIEGKVVKSIATLHEDGQIVFGDK